MPSNEFETPAALALAQFLTRIDQDDGLASAIKEAIRADVTSEGAAASFEKLAAALAAETKPR